MTFGVNTYSKFYNITCTAITMFILYYYEKQHEYTITTLARRSVLYHGLGSKPGNLQSQGDIPDARGIVLPSPHTPFMSHVDKQMIQSYITYNAVSMLFTCCY